MVIILGSTNISKKRALENALKELEIYDFEIICIDSIPGVSSKPIGYEIIRGADNRNQQSKEFANQNNINYNYLCAIEGGFSLDENGIPFVVTYVIIENSEGKKSTGKSLGIRLSKDMFDFVKDGGSLNKLIEEINEDNNNKQSQGITGFLTNGIFKRDTVDKQAVMSALMPVIFQEKRNLLSKKILEYKKDR